MNKMLHSKLVQSICELPSQTGREYNKEILSESQPRIVELGSDLIVQVGTTTDGSIEGIFFDHNGNYLERHVTLFDYASSENKNLYGAFSIPTEETYSNFLVLFLSEQSVNSIFGAVFNFFGEMIQQTIEYTTKTGLQSFDSCLLNSTSFFLSYDTQETNGEINYGVYSIDGSSVGNEAIIAEGSGYQLTDSHVAVLNCADDGSGDETYLGIVYTDITGAESAVYLTYHNLNLNAATDHIPISTPQTNTNHQDPRILNLDLISEFAIAYISENIDTKHLILGYYQPKTQVYCDETTVVSSSDQILSPNLVKLKDVDYFVLIWSDYVPSNYPLQGAIINYQTREITDYLEISSSENWKKKYPHAISHNSNKLFVTYYYEDGDSLSFHSILSLDLDFPIYYNSNYPKTENKEIIVYLTSNTYIDYSISKQNIINYSGLSEDLTSELEPVDPPTLPDWIYYNDQDFKIIGETENDFGSITFNLKITNDCEKEIRIPFQFLYLPETCEKNIQKRSNPGDFEIVPLKYFKFYFDKNIFVSVSDDGTRQSLEYTLVDGRGELNSWIRFNIDEFSMEGTAPADFQTEYELFLQASDGCDSITSDSFLLIPSVYCSDSQPPLTSPISDIILPINVNFEYMLPIDTFYDDDPNMAIEVSAEYEGSPALPSWLNFNQEGKYFYGTTPVNTGDYLIDLIGKNKCDKSSNVQLSIWIKGSSDCKPLYVSIEKNISAPSSFNIQPVNIAIPESKYMIAYQSSETGTPSETIIKYQILDADGNIIENEQDFDQMLTVDEYSENPQGVSMNQETIIFLTYQHSTPGGKDLIIKKYDYDIKTVEENIVLSGTGVTGEYQAPVTLDWYETQLIVVFVDGTNSADNPGFITAVCYDTDLKNPSDSFSIAGDGESFNINPQIVQFTDEEWLVVWERRDKSNDFSEIWMRTINYDCSNLGEPINATADSTQTKPLNNTAPKIAISHKNKRLYLVWNSDIGDGNYEFVLQYYNTSLDLLNYVNKNLAQQDSSNHEIAFIPTDKLVLSYYKQNNKLFHQLFDHELNIIEEQQINGIFSPDKMSLSALEGWFMITHISDAKEITVNIQKFTPPEVDNNAESTYEIRNNGLFQINIGNDIFTSTKNMELLYYVIEETSDPDKEYQDLSWIKSGITDNQIRGFPPQQETTFKTLYAAIDECRIINEKEITINLINGELITNEDTSWMLNLVSGTTNLLSTDHNNQADDNIYIINSDDSKIVNKKNIKILPSYEYSIVNTIVFKTEGNDNGEILIQNSGNVEFLSYTNNNILTFSYVFDFITLKITQNSRVYFRANVIFENFDSLNDIILLKENSYIQFSYLQFRQFAPIEQTFNLVYSEESGLFIWNYEIDLNVEQLSYSLMDIKYEKNSKNRKNIIILNQEATRLPDIKITSTENNDYDYLTVWFKEATIYENLELTNCKAFYFFDPNESTVFQVEGFKLDGELVAYKVNDETINNDPNDLPTFAINDKFEWPKGLVQGIQLVLNAADKASLGGAEEIYLTNSKLEIANADTTLFSLLNILNSQIIAQPDSFFQIMISNNAITQLDTSTNNFFINNGTTLIGSPTSLSIPLKNENRLLINEDLQLDKTFENTASGTIVLGVVGENSPSLTIIATESQLDGTLEFDFYNFQIRSFPYQHVGIGDPNNDDDTFFEKSQLEITIQDEQDWVIIRDTKKIYADNLGCGIGMEPKRDQNNPDHNNGECVDCMVGHSSEIVDLEFCGLCNNGTFAQITGSTKCTDCKRGSYSNEGAEECIQCPAGEYAPDPGLGSCLLCSKGKYSNAGSESCEECPVGTFNSDLGQSKCTPCKTGFYNDERGQSSCQPCAIGTFNDEEGASACKPCPVKTFTDTTASPTCTYCAAGHYNDQEGQTSCQKCQRGFYNDYDGQSDCKECATGEYSAKEGATICDVCKTGTYSSKTGSSICTNCESGKYTDQEGAKFCNQCPIGEYQENSGSSECNYCGNNFLTLQTGSMSIEKCVCKAGFYKKNGNCKTCPTGAICNSANIETPDADVGYWRQASTEDYIQCKVKEACPGGKAGQCNTDSGYTGALCQDCLEKYYHMGYECRECGNENNAWKFVLAGFVILFLCFVMFIFAKKARSYFGSFTIAFSFVQILAIMNELDLKWPSNIKRTFSIFSVFNFNIDLLATECSFTITWEEKWLIIILSPAIFLLVFVFIYVVIWLHSFAMYRFEDTFAPKRESLKKQKKKLNSTSSSASSLKKFLFRIKFNIYNTLLFQTDTKFRNTLKNNLINAYSTFLTLIYLIVSLKVVEYFDCTHQEDGTWSMDSKPEWNCLEGEWMRLFPVALTGLILYVISIPLGLALILRHYSTKLSEEEFLHKFGLLSARYSKNYYYWEIIVMLRKLAIVILRTTLGTRPLIQVLVCILTYYLAIFLQLKCNPYLELRHNYLEFLLLTVSELILFTGWIFLTEEFPTDSQKTTVSQVIIAVIWLSMSALIIMIVFEIRFKYRVMIGKELDEIKYSKEVRSGKAIVKFSKRKPKFKKMLKYFLSRNKRQTRHINNIYHYTKGALNKSSTLNNEEKNNTKMDNFKAIFLLNWNTNIIPPLISFYKNKANKDQKIKIILLILHTKSYFQKLIEEQTNNESSKNKKRRRSISTSLRSFGKKINKITNGKHEKGGSGSNDENEDVDKIFLF
ncbi:hypothetical protein M0813_09465 [Anaeramoeba flamelloides]|uniref:Cadherin domain-containing protein n=1 Tax=Anaeramoeba flamelloides TaxID=1746091 RepID=A0ABQ8X644_9EUKA|nr:hypothetical protein M0813_09465 [Anaeramoeba flamelloides]